MNLNQLIADIELYPHGVITKAYVLKHLRAIQIDYNAISDQFPIMPPDSTRELTGRIVRGGDQNRTLSKAD